VLKTIGFIYEKEEEYKLKRLTPEQRKERRDDEVAPSM